MSISVIIPTYNRRETLSQVLPYYLAQQDVKEVLVLDDGSSPPVASNDIPNDPRVQLIRLQHRGPEHARNYGLNHSREEFIFLGEDDAYPAAGLFQYLLDQMVDADAVGCRAVHLSAGHEWPQADIIPANSKSTCLYNVRRLELNVSGHSRTAVRVPYTTAWALVKRESLQNTVRFDESLRGNFFRDETDFWVSLNKAGGKVLYNPTAVMFHIPRNGGGCHTMSSLEYEFWVWWNTCRILSKHRAYLSSSWGYKGSPLINSLHYELRRIENTIARRVLRKRVDPI